MYNFVKENLILDRLDAEFYSIDQINNQKKLEDYGVKPLNSYCTGVNVGYTGELGPLYSDQGTFLYRVSDIDNIFLNIEEVKLVPEKFAIENPNIWIRDGDIVFAAVGNTIGKVALKTNSIPNGVCSRALMISRPVKNRINSHFLIVYLANKYAQKSLIRGVSGSAQPVLNTPLIANLPIIEVNLIAQKYIGNKVNQADQLHVWKKDLEIKCSELFENSLNQYGFKELQSDNIIWAVLEDRLDPAYYNKKYHFFNAEWFQSKSEPLKNFIASGSYGVLPSSSSYGKGEVRFIRATDLQNANIDVSCFTKVPQEEVVDKAKINEGDILLEIKGAIASCELAASHLAGAYVNGSIYRFTPTNINEAYLTFYLNSEIKKLYCERVSVNNIISYLDLDSIHNLPVLRLPIEVEDLIGRYVTDINLAKKYSFILVKYAKTLIEALIEGQLTEEQLIQAQKALEDGDNTLDKAILSKLSNEGYAVEGATPLFNDIDELYRLLASANAADDSED